MSSSHPYDWAWRRLRPRILARDGYRCQLCGGRADCVDHIVPLVAGGARLDPRNLRAVCRSCNVKRAHQHARRTNPAAHTRRVWPGAVTLEP